MGGSGWWDHKPRLARAACSWKGPEQTLPQSLQKDLAPLLALDLMVWGFCLHSCETTCFCCLKPPRWWFSTERAAEATVLRRRHSVGTRSSSVQTSDLRSGYGRAA